MKKIEILFLILLGAGLLSCSTTEVDPVSPVETNQIEVQEEQPAELSAEEEEFLRSTAEVNVSIDVFKEDKKQVMKLISELDEIMKDFNYDAWIKYVDRESIEYWSKKSNLQKAAARLPIKGLRLNNLKDYFVHVFVPSRVGRTIDEIRYETENLVKAVQIDENRDTIYYNFQKINGQWKIHLPPLSE